MYADTDADTDTEPCRCNIDQDHIMSLVCRQQMREYHTGNASEQEVMPIDLREGRALLQQGQVTVAK